MSLKPHPILPVPAMTAAIAHAAFPKGTTYLTLRDELGTLFSDADFADLYPTCGQPGLSPWRLALITLLQFRENLSDRQAAEAVRARIDWKYLLGLDLRDAGFDFSVLCEFRARLLAGKAEARLLDRLLEFCRRHGFLKARGRQRTDSTHVLAAVRQLSRLELVGETLRAALNEIATVAPEWLQRTAPAAWYERYNRRIEASRLPSTSGQQQAYAQQIGEDGVVLLAWLESPEVPATLRELPQVKALRTAWERHYTCEASPEGGAPQVQFKPSSALAQAEAQIESPYDWDARYRHKRDTQWTGYMVHFSETCDPETVPLITHVHTTTAAAHEALSTATIHQALKEKALPPQEHLVDAAYVSADLLVQSQSQYGIDLIGPARPNQEWQGQIAGGYTVEYFTIHWEDQVAYYPQGIASTEWREYRDKEGKPYFFASFPTSACQPCPAHALCTQSKKPPRRRLRLHPRPQQEALQAARQLLKTEAGRRRYACRAGVEGTLSQGVRGFGLRRSRYRGLAKTHLQQVATAAAINVDRLGAWLIGRPQAVTRISRFAALAPS
jgi:transposase